MCNQDIPTVDLLHPHEAMKATCCSADGMVMGLLSGMDMPLSHASKLLCEISTITRLCCCDLVGDMLFFHMSNV